MREALSGLPDAAQLHTDFYDRERLATWVNEYPGVAAWVRDRAGRPLFGWSGVGDWQGRGNNDRKPYLLNDNACLIDDSQRDGKRLTISEGIERLRHALRTPRQCIRLIGLSGVGKTRFVQVLFEHNVGNDPLDPSLAIYTDYSVETIPPARDMARDLIERRQPAILIVDNCNPATHSELARLCASSESEVSLITIEYDVRDDEPEHTDVFRLESASTEVVTDWIKQTFPDVSQVDGERIARFSDGNFRVAGALARTIRKGQTLGNLRDRSLFERIFHQGRAPDRQLLRDAEDLSLLYSIEGEDISEEGELARVSAIRGVGAGPLFEALVEMRERGVVQARGRFRAILPQAIANALAEDALKRTPPSVFDQFCADLPERMLTSVSRRLGYLHDSEIAQSTVARWLRSDGPLGNLFASRGNGFQIVNNIAPVAPELVLTRLEEELALREGPMSSSWASLIKAIGYEPQLFDRVITLLAHSAAREPESNNLSSAHSTFSDFFHIQLSGTQALPEQRRAAIRRLALSDDENFRKSAQIALRALLKSNHFIASSSHDFGARPRDWGWRPKINQEAWDWFQQAIVLALELAPEREARAFLAEEARDLWRYSGCRDALDRAATVFLQTRPWIEGWISLRAALRFDGQHMPVDVRARLEQLIERLKPTDLLNQARAVILNSVPGGDGWDFADGEDDQNDAQTTSEKVDRMAHEIGRALAHDAGSRAKFLPEALVAPHAMRAFECGRGLAESAEDLSKLWTEIATAYEVADPKLRDPRLLRGFIRGARTRDSGFTSLALDQAIDDPHLASILPYLQGGASIDTIGIARLRRAIAKGVLKAPNFVGIMNGSVSNSPSDELASLLKDIATLEGGNEIAVEILHMHLFRHRDETAQRSPCLVSRARELLVHADFSKGGPMGDLGASTVMLMCLGGDEAEATAKKVSENLCAALDRFHVSSHSLSHSFEALLKTQPFVTLDVFLLSPAPHGLRSRFDLHFNMGVSLERIEPALLQAWADRDPRVCYPLLGSCLSMFLSKNGERGNGISPLFLTMLDCAPDKAAFLGEFWDRVHPQSWGGSLAHILLQRKSTMLARLENHADAAVRAWVTKVIPELDRAIDEARRQDRQMEESFE